MKYTLIILGTILIAALTGCEKERLPRPSQRGRNLVAWRTDGDASIAKGESFIGGNRASYTLGADSVLSISGFGSSDNIVTLRCRFEELNTPLPLFVYQATLSSNCDDVPMGHCVYQTTPDYSGTVTVTYYDGNIIAGIFRTDVMNEAGEVKHITDGRFDIKSE